MTDGRVFGNGAEIKFTENGGIIARPADGQELIVEDDARVGTLEAGSALINNFPSDDHRQEVKFDSFDSVENGEIVISSDEFPIHPRDYGDEYGILEILEYTTISGTNPELTLSFDTTEPDGTYNFALEDENGVFDSRTTGANEITLLEKTSDSSVDRQSALFYVYGEGNGRVSFSEIASTNNFRGGGLFLKRANVGGASTGDRVTRDSDLILSSTETTTLSIAYYQTNRRGDNQ